MLLSNRQNIFPLCRHFQSAHIQLSQTWALDLLSKSKNWVTRKSIRFNFILFLPSMLIKWLHVHVIFLHEPTFNSFFFPSLVQISVPTPCPRPPIYGCYAPPWCWPSWKARGDPFLRHVRGENSDPPSVSYTLSIRSPKIHAYREHQGPRTDPRPQGGDDVLWKRD